MLLQRLAHREHKSLETRVSSLCEPEVLSGLENQRQGKGRIRGVFKLTLVYPILLLSYWGVPQFLLCYLC